MIRLFMLVVGAIITYILALGTAQTGRSVSRWTDIYLDDSGGTLRKLSGVKTISGLGLNFPIEDVTALSDAVKNGLPNTPEAQIEIGGKLDNTASIGTHIVLSGVNGLSVPLTFDVRFGIQHAWEAGEPQWGITSSATSGMLVTKYEVDQELNFTATLIVMGPTAPAWGTAAET